MPDIYVHMKPEAERAFRERRAQVIAHRRLGLITSDQAREQLANISDEFMRSEFFDSDPDRNVGVRCKDCGKLHVMPASVSHFTCPCTPHTQRSAHVNQVPLS